MDESEDNLNSEELKSTDSPLTVRSKPKKRSLIERELETNLTARITSPVTVDGTSTSRYGRARRLKSEIDQPDTKKVTSELKSPLSEKSPMKAQTQSPVYKMHASNSPLKRTESPKKVVVEKFLDNQIESIYQENISLSRFGNEEVNTVTSSPAKKFPKVYIRKDLIQKREPEDTVIVIQNMFSPIKSKKKSSNTHLNNILERSSERYSLSNKQQNGYLDNSSVVKTLDFDGKKKKKEPKEKGTPSKSELFELEAKCAYQVGDLAWARMGTYPFWPCIVTRDPSSGVFVKKKLFGRIERDIIHVTFFGDNGRRGWIVDSMLRKYMGQLEFEAARENFTPEAKKKDPRLYAAFFVSEKKQALWNTSVEEAEMLLREPKRLRIDIFNDMLEKSRSTKVKQPKSKMSRTDSDVSLSESLYDSLFSEDDGKSDNNDRSKNRSRNKSLDMFEVVTACLDNMAAKTGITKIQRQSHMDRWLQKAKSKTPEKTKGKAQVPIKKLEEKKDVKVNGAKRKKVLSTKRPVQKSYSLRKANESQNLENSHNYSISSQDDIIGTDSDQTSTDTDNGKHISSKDVNGLGIIIKVESIAGNSEEDNLKRKDSMANDVSSTTESPKNSSMDVNGINESDTYTDEESQDSSSIGTSANNNSVDEEKKSDLQSQNGKNISKDVNTSHDSCDFKLPLDKEQASEIHSTESMDSIDSKIGSETLNSEIENTEYLNNNIQKESLDRITDPEIVTNTDCQGFSTISSEPSIELQAKNEKSIDNQDDRLDNIESTEISSTNEDSQSQSTVIDESSIETDYISQGSSNIVQEKEKVYEKEKLHDVNKDVPENDDDMSIDDDSDSERLPYSPLSNLGNNSDDNLSLDDVPFIDDNVTESKKLNNVQESEKVEDGNFKLTEELENNEQIEHTKDELNTQPMVISKNLTETVLANGYISDDSDIQKSNSNKKSDDNDIQKPNSNEKNNDIEVSSKDMTDESTMDSMETVPSNGYREENVTEIEMECKEIRIYVPDYKPENKKVNGIHNMNGDIDLDTVSIHSEDSASSSRSETRRKLRSKQDKKQEDPLENPDFVKYMELRQDAIIDENPELTEKEIVAYLYKTWLYEESVKSDDKKNDDLRECNLVKGLNKNQVEPPPRKRNLCLKNKSQSPKTNTLQRYLRRNKAEQKSENENEEVCFFKKRGARKNMIKYDDEDSADEERSKQSNNTQKNDSSQIESDNSENIEQPCLPIGNSIETSDNNKKSNDFSLEIKEQELTSIENSEGQPTSTKTAEEPTNNSDEIKNKDLPIKESNHIKDTPTIEKQKTVIRDDLDCDSIDSEDSEAPLIRCKLRSKVKKENSLKEGTLDRKIKEEDTISINSEDSEISVTKRKKKLGPKNLENAMGDPEFVNYLELRQDALIEENPELTQDEIIAYLYQTWLYEQDAKSDIKKTDEMEQANLVKGLNETVPQQQIKKVKRKVPKTEKTEKETVDEDLPLKDKPKRKSVKPFYNEEYSDIEEELEVFEIFKPKNKEVVKVEPGEPVPETEQTQEVEVYDEVELYFAELTKPKPNIFKGLIREKVCEICEKVGNLVKCKGCNGMFHLDCVKKQTEVVEIPAPPRGRKKKKRQGRKPKNSEEFDNDDKQDISEENNVSIEEILETDSHTVDADVLEAQLSAKMKEILESTERIEYDSYSSDDGLGWNETVPGKCEIIDVKLKPRHSESDYSDFKCNNCQKYDVPICFVCKDAVSKKDSMKRQKCHVAHCHKYYHLECLDHWPQTQFNGGEPSKNNKKISEHFEAMTCPRHVCHTCVSDDPRGCKTRFSGDKLARCVRCPATYHSFTKCLPAGTQILTASHIICPRHYEHRPGKVPCHVNTGWCFICALGGSLICCEYCPTSFHAECLNIDPPEGGYMCEDCETGRLPLYGEMVWVKLGHYRWWPGIILHPYEIPENLLAVKHSLGEFVVRFFGQYDHYWVNRGRVFPFQEGDSGRISSQKSKIDAAFTTAMEHAQRACEILKTAQPNEEESLDIASSLLPPHYVKLKVNKPCGSLCGRKLEDPESSLTQCECNPLDDDPCGPYSHCLNRMLLTECGPTCRAGDRCNNRAFEKRLYPKLVPYRTPSRGWGLKTLEDIKAGQFVIEYVGELIDEEETRRRMRRKHEMRDENFYFLTLDKERMIDAGPKGNLARFMNHCCEPNCETQKWTVLGDVRVGLFALYDIPAHSEVTFNYNLECAGIDKKRCMCGAKRCSGYIGAKPKQDESQTKKNKLQPGKRTYKKRKPEESPTTKNKPKRPIGRPPKPRELTEIEKDLLIIRNATNGLSSDESSRSLSSEFDRHPKALKRKRVSFSTEEVIVYDGTESPSVKKNKLDERIEGD